MRHRHDQKIDVLSKVSIFRGCTREEFSELARITTEVDVPAGEVLCHEGEIGKECFFVVDGTAAVTIGGEEVNTIGPGGFFGEMSLLDGGPRVATVTARTPMDLLALSRPEFVALLDHVPTVSARMLASLAARFREAELQLHPSHIGV